MLRAVQPVRRQFDLIRRGMFHRGRTLRYASFYWMFAILVVHDYQSLHDFAAHVRRICFTPRHFCFFAGSEFAHASIVVRFLRLHVFLAFRHLYDVQSAR